MVPFTYKQSTTVTVCSRLSCTVFVAFQASILEITCDGLNGMSC